MSSEAAQKAYPDVGDTGAVEFILSSPEDEVDDLRAAFDRGAVEALRQAAEALHAVNMPEAGWLVEGMADDREMRQ